MSDYKVFIREETSSDIDEIFQLTQAAFEDAPHTSRMEGHIVNALRRRGQLALSMVAVRDRQIVGHVAYSPLKLSSGTAGWFGIGPVSVRPDSQRQGIGSLLMSLSLFTIKQASAQGCALVGDPAFYSRFGFKHCQHLALPEVPSEFFMALSFASKVPCAKVQFDEAFDIAVDETAENVM